MSMPLLGAVASGICGAGAGFALSERRRHAAPPVEPLPDSANVNEPASASDAPRVETPSNSGRLHLSARMTPLTATDLSRLHEAVSAEPARQVTPPFMFERRSRAGSDEEDPANIWLSTRGAPPRQVTPPFMLERRSRSVSDEEDPANFFQSQRSKNEDSVSSDTRNLYRSEDNLPYEQGLLWLQHLLPDAGDQDLENLLQSNGSSLTMLSRNALSNKLRKAEDIFTVPVQERSRKVFGLGGYSKQTSVMLCMVGLPARGKSYIVQMLTRYLQWQGFPVKAFNAGALRRKCGHAGASADFFKGEQSAKMRDDLATQCMEEAVEWLTSQDGVSVAIFDATNTTKKRRQTIFNGCQEPGITPVFIESICDDARILEQNYRMKLDNDDYKNTDPVQARADFLDRVKAYEARYQTVEDDECAGAIRYIKLFNVGQKVVMMNCSGYVTANVGFYLSNIHISPRKIWLMRHAETEAQRKGQLGSVSGEITYSGAAYCRDVAMRVHKSTEEFKQVGDLESADVLVLTGTAPVHASTCEGLKVADRRDGERGSEAAAAVGRFPVMSTSLLNELDGGECNGMSYDHIRKEYSQMWADRERDKLNFRYPGAGGESYVDVIHRLGPVIIELERQHRSLLVISHLAVMKCIYGYFVNTPIQDIPHLKLEMHTLYELTPGPHGTLVVPLNMAPPPTPSGAKLPACLSTVDELDFGLPERLLPDELFTQ